MRAAARRIDGVARADGGRSEALAARLPAVHFLDLHDKMCEGAACGPFVPGGGGVVGWDDANHLSSEGQWSLWPELCEFFEARALVVRARSYLVRSGGADGARGAAAAAA